MVTTPMVLTPVPGDTPHDSWEARAPTPVRPVYPGEDNSLAPWASRVSADTPRHGTSVWDPGHVFDMESSVAAVLERERAPYPLGTLERRHESPTQSHFGLPGVDAQLESMREVEAMLDEAEADADTALREAEAALRARSMERKARKQAEAHANQLREQAEAQAQQAREQSAALSVRQTEALARSEAARDLAQSLAQRNAAGR